MARSYLPSKVSEIVAIWRKDLHKVIPYLVSSASFLIYHNFRCLEYEHSGFSSSVSMLFLLIRFCFVLEKST